MTHSGPLTDYHLTNMGHKYSLIPAGSYYSAHAGLAIYIKYQTNVNEIRVVETSPHHTVINCPDRVLHLVCDRNREEPWPIDFSFDEMVVPSYFWPRAGESLQNNAYMLNRPQAFGKEASCGLRRTNGRPLGDRQTIYSDSGGFQLMNEGYDYISPESLAEWYSENVDVGIVLDFPSRDTHWPGLIERMGQAQANATERLLRAKSDELELMQVFHGESTESVNRFRSIVERPELGRRVAMGGLYYGTILQKIHHVCQIIDTGHKYEQYHLLGVSKISQLFLIMRLAAGGFAPYITSDSTTYLNEALNKHYFTWPSIVSPPRFYPIGDKENRPNANRILPCSCVVCSAIKYSDVFSVFGGNAITFLFMYHNLYSFQAFTRTMYEVVRDSTLKDLKSVLRRQLETRANGRDEVLSGLDYVDHVLSNGVEEAGSRLTYFLGTGGDEEEGPARSLFAAPSVESDEIEAEDSVEGDLEPYRVRMNRILDIYINNTAAPDDKPGQKVKKRDLIKTTRGHTKANARGVRVPGKKRVKKRTPTK